MLFFTARIGEAEVEAVTRVLRSGWITTGAEARAFEQEFAKTEKTQDTQSKESENNPAPFTKVNNPHPDPKRKK